MTQEEIKLLPHKMVDGMAILLTESEIEELNQPPSEQELINRLNLAKQSKINRCKVYLEFTDWYIIRSIDPSSGAVVPELILTKRALARSLQDEILACSSIEQINNININFE